MFFRGATSGTAAATLVVMNSNDIGVAQKGQRNLSEATADLAGQFGFDLVGEMIGNFFKGMFEGVVKPAAPKDLLEIPAFDEEA